MVSEWCALVWWDGMKDTGGGGLLREWGSPKEEDEREEEEEEEGVEISQGPDTPSGHPRLPHCADAPECRFSHHCPTAPAAAAYFRERRRYGPCAYMCIRVRVPCARTAQCSSNPPHWTPAHTPSFIGNGGHISSTAKKGRKFAETMVMSEENCRRTET